MFQSRKYNNPPLVEAIIEVIFQPEEGRSIFDKIGEYERLVKEELPFMNIIPKTNVSVSFDNTGIAAVDTKEDGASVYQFSNTSRNQVVQIWPDRIAINHLQPYNGWEFFEPIALRHIAAVQELTGMKHVRATIVRYVNKVDLPETREVNLTDYFAYGISLPANGFSALSIANFNWTTDLLYRDSKDILSLQLYTVLNNNNLAEYSFVFDLLYQSSIDNITDLKDWLESAHIRMNTAFEACITDKCRELFN